MASSPRPSEDEPLEPQAPDPESVAFVVVGAALASVVLLSVVL